MNSIVTDVVRKRAFIAWRSRCPARRGRSRPLFGCFWIWKFEHGGKNLLDAAVDVAHSVLRHRVIRMALSMDVSVHVVRCTVTIFAESPRCPHILWSLISVIWDRVIILHVYCSIYYTFAWFIVRFYVVEHPRDELVPVPTSSHFPEKTERVTRDREHSRPSSSHQWWSELLLKTVYY